MPKPLVSIIIPFKNTDLYIFECVESITNQSYVNWQAVFVDDHSTDNSMAIVKKFAAIDARILILTNQGNGIIAALRTGFDNSQGEYITRMDSDDIMTPNRIVVMVNSLETHGKKHLAIGQVKYFRKDGISDGFARYEKWLNKLTSTGQNYSEIYKECVVPSPCWMLHREDFIACEGFEPNRYPEDYDLTFRFYREGYRCIPNDNILLHWRDYSTRTSRTHKHYAQNHFIDIKIHYFLDLDYDNSRPLAVWGAGTKGKTVAKLLIKLNIPFYWICDNPKKIGKHIYGQELLDFNYLSEIDQPQSIVTVANEMAQEEIKAYFKKQNMKSMTDYFFFC